MTDQAMSIDANSVRKVVSVRAPQTVAWRVFTGKMGTWWPLANYKIGKANAVNVTRGQLRLTDWHPLRTLVRSKRIPAACRAPASNPPRRERPVSECRAFCSRTRHFSSRKRSRGLVVTRLRNEPRDSTDGTRTRGPGTAEALV
jgi:hypothetical protein